MPKASSKTTPDALQTAERRTYIVNGTALTAEAAMLGALLDELGYRGAKIATAVNGAFVPAGERGSKRLEAGDRIEIVAPRQGG